VAVTLEQFGNTGRRLSATGSRFTSGLVKTQLTKKNLMYTIVNCKL
jgi:hypothetical protein